VNDENRAINAGFGERRTAGMSEEVKVYEVDSCYWWAARSAQEALDDYNAQGFADEPITEPPTELSIEDMRRLKYRDDDFPEPVTFEEQLHRVLAARIERIPCMFATTEY
jgi:hypothetical protein